ncbi:MAG: class I SAM-dependent methyltransferase [Nanoarchaeota archaeon]|nr:class I SAM-dependent methyltransferase [Nanoarchaeota archaeon]MBU1320891.1 class I SAM-dependent methyltransferase [Nanoarchaeota archaeon]MBU1597585.1 class I SAM-dependent methyltransferase [Nanoarchaeota archaeon]MBU2441219.1 class I SAM-dependent methyltransferase [Nanoarchaeota archaeon]
MKKKYSLETVNKVYSYWGKSLISYKWGVSFFGYWSVLRKKAIEKLNLKKGDVVVDLACGPGLIFNLLEEKVGAKGKIIAVDYVHEMIKQCMKQVRRKKYKNITLIQEDAAKLKLKNNSVDAIISVIGLSAIPEHKSALKNCYSALKKGGRLVVLDAKQPNKKYGLWSLLLGLLRWSKSYEKKDLIKDIKKVFGNIQVEEHVLGSTFISVSKK